MGADGFTVDYQTLGDLGQQLANLRGEFDRGQDALGPLLDTISDDGLRSKLVDFTKNWSDKKEGITKRLNEAATFAIGAAGAYRDVDESGAQAFSAAGGGGG
jgi:hypothetical protein